MEPKLIPQPASFRPDKSCINQILALTDHIDEGCENKLITVLVQMSKLLAKIYETTSDCQLVKIIIVFTTKLAILCNLCRRSYKTIKQHTMGITFLNLTSLKQRSMLSTSTQDRLNVIWNSIILEHTDKPVYLGVKLD